jgi:hypothetical protein
MLIHGFCDPHPNMEQENIMKKCMSVITMAFLVLSFTCSLKAGGPNGKGEEYHHALDLCFRHIADHAIALFDQVSSGEINRDITDDFLEQMTRDLDRARVYNVTTYSCCSEVEAKAVSDDRLAILGGHATAVSAIRTLSDELQKQNPDLQTIKTLTTVILDGVNKAAVAHRDAMKKLGIAEIKGPGV